ncbi:vitamin B12-dependent ribonucleotide reductase [Candidatus Poribacteria bacterium]|nr:vitamin B12-dependent ribonucleotide reductase [Candidatus Poribacteria bacterium]
MRYLIRNEEGKPIEEPEDMFRRVAQNIASADKLYNPDVDIEKTEEEFYNIMADLEFLPNSPTLMNAGRELQQLSACFVLPIDDSMPSIFETLKNTALIHKSGGGTGFSFSRIRPKNDIVKSTSGVASGPISFMSIFDSATEEIKQGGTRRGANMAILRVDHPDIMEFITCKHDNNKLNNFNISVGLTEKFMERVAKEEEYELINPRTGKAIKKVNAKDVFNRIVKGAWKNGDPGIVFLDRINRDNPTPELGEIESTNPCGEQPLLPYESCNLGSINLLKMVKRDNGNWVVDWEKLKDIIYKAVHFLDNVIDMNNFPLPEIEEKTKSNRKVGLGIMAWSDMLIRLGIPYNSSMAVQLAESVMEFIDYHAEMASVELAKERGPFPNFDKSIFKDGNRKHNDRTTNGNFGRPELDWSKLQKMIKEHGIRGAAHTTIAPTGTISLVASVSSGIEPPFGICHIRKAMDGEELVMVHPLFEEMAKAGEFYNDELIYKIHEEGSIQEMEEIPEELRKLFVTSHDISPEWHVRMQAAFQNHTDNAVSKTVNFKNEATKEDVERVYMLAYELGCKGVTIYRDGSRDEQILNIGKTQKVQTESSQEANPMPRGSMAPRPRPLVTAGSTRKIETAECGSIYITVNEDEEGLCEVFINMGRSGGCRAAQCEAIGVLISTALRAGVDPDSISKRLKGIRCASPSWQPGGMILSCADAIGKAMEQYTEMKIGKTREKQNKVDDLIMADICPECPECGNMLEYSEGCVICKLCGYSKCW